MGEEWFKEQYGHIPRIDLPRMPTPPIYECGSFTSSCATTERTTTDRPSPRPEEAPFTLAGAIAVQAITEGLAAATLPASAVIIALPEGPLDHDMESPATSTLSSPCAASPTALPHTAVVEVTLPSSLLSTGPEIHPTPSFPPSRPSAAAAGAAAAAASVPPPEPAQSPKPGPKGRPKSKGVRALAK